MIERGAASERARLARDEDEEVRYQAVCALDTARPGELDLLIERLGDPSWRVRLAAVERISALETPAQALPALLAMLGSAEGPGTQNAAAAALARIGAAAVPALLERLSAPVAKIRTAAVEVLGEIRDRRSAPIVSGGLRDPDPNVRAATAEALGKIGGEEAVRALFHALDHPDPALQLGVLEALCRLERAPPLARLMALARAPALRRPIHRLLGASAEPGADDMLAAALSDPSRGCREAALAGIGALRARLSGRALDRLAASVRMTASADGALVPRTFVALSARDPAVVAGALAVLGWTGDPRHAPAMARVAEDEELRPAVAEALASMEPGIAAAIIPTLPALTPAARSAALMALARLGDLTVLPALLAAAAEEEEGVRAAAIEALGRLGDPRAVAPLAALLFDPDGAIAGAAAAALVLHASAGSAARGAVLAECRRWLALSPPAALFRILRQLADADDLAPMCDWVSRGDARVRRAAAEAIGDAAPESRGARVAEVAGTLRRALGDAEAPVRAAAANALGRIGAALPAGATSGNPTRDELAAALLAPLADAEPMVRAAAAEALGRAGSSAHAPALAALARDGATPAEAAVAAVRALAALGAVDARVLEGAARHGDPEVVKEAIAAAAHVAGAAAAKLIVEAAAHARWDVRRAAARALCERRDRSLLDDARRLAAREDDPLVADALTEAVHSLEAVA